MSGQNRSDSPVKYLHWDSSTSEYDVELLNSIADEFLLEHDVERRSLRTEEIFLAMRLARVDDALDFFSSLDFSSLALPTERPKRL